jgi:hypothetical protein
MQYGELRHRASRIAANIVCERCVGSSKIEKCARSHGGLRCQIGALGSAEVVKNVLMLSRSFDRLGSQSRAEWF